MVEFELLISVIAMFFIRIGIPLLVLIILGVVVDRWQTKREQEYFSQNNELSDNTLQSTAQH